MNLANTPFFKNQCFIDGQWLSSSDTAAVHNPANGEVITHVPMMGAADTERAIQAAERAQREWRQRSADERATLLKRWHQLVVENSRGLGELMSLEQGKPVAEAEGEVLYAASYIEWFAEEARRLYGETIPGHQADKRIVVTREAVGVCAAITPWNFPAAMIARKVAPALAAGCSIIVKPALETPLSAFALAALAEQAGLPAGVFNVISGHAPDIGNVLTASPVVRKLSFTGSTAVGAKLMADSAANLKKLSLELGGNAPFIVFDDADIEHATDELIKGKFRNAGQTCVCPNRVYVQRGVYAEFSERLQAKVANLRVGPGSEPDTDIGPLISRDAADKVKAQIDDALGKGAELLCGGQRHERGDNWFQPSVIGNANRDMLCAREETFGPLIPLFPFSDEAEVIAAANATEFGLAAYLFSNNIHTIERTTEELEYGMVGINTGMISTAVAPFGGIKSSGFGREGSHFGIEDYTELKYRCYHIAAR
ncbi:MAG: succinate-semialdehyde dehydrogenase (NADP(+)) [Spongiibacter sp.]|uniref:NAD-dependent succinate-semialdehyde dehydrogenase n=1 Tax=Spongiibacter sp. TaxID=2024860 RepID=UPI000C093317|nr:succinate-semialdehyde dehydrogenase (NADP(+)) [Spongiibacter sp.]